MRIIYLGTPEFAVPSLSILLDHGFDVPAVVTAPDKPGGRLGLQESPVKQFALKHGLRIFQPLKLKDPAFLSEIAGLKADLQVVVAFRMMPEALWGMPPMGTMNLHGSLLPKYRGAAPINWAIINGEKETGVTTFLLKHAIDTGDILFQERIAIGEHETAGELHDRMMLAGANLVLKSVQALAAGTAVPQAQPNEAATHAPKIFTETCRIDFLQPSQSIHNFIRGLSPYPGAWCMFEGKMLKILRAIPVPQAPAPVEPGRFYSDGKQRLWLGVGDGYIALQELQLEGKRRMSPQEFLNGHKGNWAVIPGAL